MKIGLIFALGVGILIGAILLNVISSRFGLSNWYEFVQDPGKISLISYVWLFVIYPFGLGAVAYFVSKFLNI